MNSGLQNLVYKNWEHHCIAWYAKYFDILNCLGMNDQCVRWTKRQVDQQNYDSNSVHLTLCTKMFYSTINN